MMPMRRRALSLLAVAPLVLCAPGALAADVPNAVVSGDGTAAAPAFKYEGARSFTVSLPACPSAEGETGRVEARFDGKGDPVASGPIDRRSGGFSFVVPIPRPGTPDAWAPNEIHTIEATYPASSGGVDRCDSVFYVGVVEAPAPEPGASQSGTPPSPEVPPVPEEPVLEDPAPEKPDAGPSVEPAAPAPEVPQSAPTPSDVASGAPAPAESAAPAPPRSDAPDGILAPVHSPLGAGRTSTPSLPSTRSAPRPVEPSALSSPAEELLVEPRARRSATNEALSAHAAGERGAAGAAMARVGSAAIVGGGLLVLVAGGVILHILLVSARP